MATKLLCPSLHGEVELTDERERHIRDTHPELLPQYREYLVHTLADPDEVRRDVRFPNSWLFSHWFLDVKGGKFVMVVVVVVADPAPADRHWIVTAYVARQLSGGVVEWTRP